MLIGQSISDGFDNIQIKKAFHSLWKVVKFIIFIFNLVYIIKINISPII